MHRATILHLIASEDGAGGGAGEFSAVAALGAADEARMLALWL
jgi:hypothetical protein